jgi:3-oxoacyl-[acyl-carrier-protein] synthase-3
MAERYAKITGWGKYVPEKVLTNADFEKMVDTTDEWITSRTGIKERHIRGEGENASDMSVKSGMAALAKAGLAPEELDLIIVACSSPDYLVPGVATIVQHKLGAKCGAFQISAGCGGWVYALVTASQFIQSGTMNKVLVIGTEILSMGIDYTDRTTCVLFGDASASVVLQGTDNVSGVLAYELGSDGSGAMSLYVPAAGSAMPLASNVQEILDSKGMFLRMDGAEVFKFATRVLSSSMKRVLEKAGLLAEDIQLFIPHQANLRIIETAARMMRQPLEKFMVNLQKYGNTSAASVPLALVEAFEEGRCKEGDKVLMCAFGAGLTWASALVQLGEVEKADEKESMAQAWLSGGKALYAAKRAVNRVQDSFQNFMLNWKIRQVEAARRRKAQGR